MLSLDLEAYQAAQNMAAFYPVPQSGYLRFAGADRLDFLQRQTSNDVRLLAPGQALQTVLTSPTARILDVLCLLQEDTLLAALTLPRYVADTARFLHSRIFFMDKVTVSDASADYIQVEIFGPQAGDALQQLGFSDLPLPGQALDVGLAAAVYRLLALDPRLGLGYRLLAPSDAGPQLFEKLVAGGLQRLDERVYELLRVEAGLPGAQHELTEAYTPLEVGLDAIVSDRKGCYTGQEVLARQRTYDKVTQRLIGLALEAPLLEGRRVWVEGQAAGELTSFAHSPRFGPIGLAVLKRPYYQPGQSVIVGESAGVGVAASVVALPFGSAD